MRMSVRVGFVLSVLLALWLAPAGLAAEVETSVVQLEINGRKVSETFELVDLGDNVLLPLRGTAALLDAQAQLDPGTMTAKIARSWDQQEATLDLKRQVFAVSGSEQPLNPQSLAMAGDFFLPSPAIELLLDAKVEWDVPSQVLRLSTSRDLAMFKAPAKTISGEKTQTAGKEQKPVNAAPPLSLGSIQYVFTDGRTSDETRWPVKDELRLDGHFQLFGVPLDISGKARNFTSEDREWALDRATATYSSPKAEIVLGDTTFDLGQILENADIRGVRFASPFGWTSGQLYAVTTIEGWVTPGSRVELRINGYFLGTDTPEDGHYRFTRVPLQITSANAVSLTIIEPDGRTTTESRVIAATPRLLAKGQVQSAGGWGWVREREDGEEDRPDAWEAIVQGGALYAGVTSRITVGASVARRVELDEEQAPVSPAALAGDVGIALRAADRLVFSLDWLVSRPENTNRRPDQGAELAANLQLGNTAWQSVVFYREQDLSLFSNLLPGVKGFKVIGEIPLSAAWNLQTTYERSEAVSGEPEDPTIKGGAVLRWASPSGDSSVLKLEREVKGTDIAAWTYRHSTGRTELGLELQGNWAEGEDESPEFSQATTRIDFRRLLGKNAVGSLSRFDQIRQTVRSSEFYESARLHQSETEAELSMFPGKNRVSVAGSWADSRWLDGEADYQVQRGLSLDLSRSFGPATVGVMYGVVQNLNPELDDEALKAAAYVWAKKRGTGLSGQLRGDYTRPLLGEGYAESIKYTARGGYQLRGGLYLGLEGYAERVSDGEPDYYVGLTLSQGLGFSNGGVRGFRAVGGRPMGYIEGTVYLDANRNGRRDRGEKGLPGVPVSLAGRSTKTDKEGYYCFEFVNPGTYSLGLDPNNLQADYTPLTESRLVKLQSNANYTQDFGVALNGTIEGIVFLDQNRDGKVDKTESRLAWVKLLLDGKVETFTDEKGGFSFGNVDPGKHLLAIDSTSLPPGLAAPPPREIEITEDELDVWDVLVPLKY